MKPASNRRKGADSQEPEPTWPGSGFLILIRAWSLVRDPLADLVELLSVELVEILASHFWGGVGRSCGNRNRALKGAEAPEGPVGALLLFRTRGNSKELMQPEFQNQSSSAALCSKRQFFMVGSSRQESLSSYLESRICFCFLAFVLWLGRRGDALALPPQRRWTERNGLISDRWLGISRFPALD